MKLGDTETYVWYYLIEVPLTLIVLFEIGISVAFYFHAKEEID